MLGSAATEGCLLERDEFLAALTRALLEATAGAGSVTLVVGPAGIGKTEVLRAAGRMARQQGATVLEARGGELEVAHPLGVLRQLFAATLQAASAAGDSRLLSGPAGTSCTLIEASGGPPELGTLLHGLYWLVSNLSETQPVLLVVDDLHWADEQSLAFCHYLARRIGDLPVVLLLAERRPEPGLERSPLSALSAEPAVTMLELPPLSQRAVSDLVRSTAGAADGAFCQAVGEATGGNPLLVEAVLAEVDRHGLGATAASAARVEDLVPEAVSRQVLTSLERLPEPHRRFAEAIAALGSADLWSAATVAEIDPEKAAACADSLAAAGLLRSGRPLEFLHPLIRATVHAAMPLGHRGLLHRRAAAVLDQSSAPAATVAGHLLRCEPAGEPWVVTTLRRAAGLVMAQGAPESAVTYLERAIDEPVERAERPDVLLELGLALAMAGRVEQCCRVLDEALRSGLDPRRQVETTLLLAEVVGAIANDPGASMLVLDGLSEVAVPADLREQLRTARTLLRALNPTGPEHLPSLPEARHLADVHGPRRSTALAVLAQLALWSGEPAAVVQELAEAAREEAGDDAVGLLAAAMPFLYLDHFSEARELIEAAMEVGRRAGSPYLHGAPLVWRGHLWYRIGRLDDAEADCRATRDVIQELNAQFALTYPCSFLADVLIERGALDEAEQLLAEVVPGSWGYTPWFLETRARLRLSEGRLDDSLADLTVLEEIADRLRSPSYVPWRSTMALALAQAGDLDRALRFAAEEVELAVAQGTPRAAGIALRVLGVVEGGDSGADRLRESVELLEHSGGTLELARSLCELGASVRRARHPKEAREPLRRAVDLAQRSGATVLVDRASEELAAAGAKPRRTAVVGVNALTPRELRVVELAAEGLSNKELAQTLFVSTWTVASHLTAAYRKLGITGRDELAAALAARDAAPDPMSH